jgi:hypothetical protein
MSRRQVWQFTTPRVQVTQVAIPAQGDDVDNQDAMLHGHVFKVCKLHPWPDHKVLGEAGYVGVFETFLGGRAFEVGHGGEEESWEGEELALQGCI